MKVELSGIGKRYSREWILKDVDLQIASGEHLAILGGNGSGKSTLLKIISGYLTPTQGSIEYQLDGNSIAQEDLFRHISFVAPYQDVYRKMTLKELVRFHFSLRDWRSGSETEMFTEMLGLPTNEPISTFSSGMVQRLKLGLALHTDSALHIFDEPTMNLDDKASAWFIEELGKLRGDATVIIASNLPGAETSTCTKEARIDARGLTI